MKSAKDIKVGDRFRMEEETSPGLTEVVIHEVVQVYNKRKFNGPIRIVKTDKGASLNLDPESSVELE